MGKIRLTWILALFLVACLSLSFAIEDDYESNDLEYVRPIFVSLDQSLVLESEVRLSIVPCPWCGFFGGCVPGDGDTTI